MAKQKFALMKEEAYQVSQTVPGSSVIKPTLEREYGEIPLDRIRSNPNQPRKIFIGIEELADSMEEKGQLEPIVVRRIAGENDIFLIVCGERRYRAATMKQWAYIRAEVILSPCTDDDAIEMALAENIARNGLHPLEEAEAYCERLNRTDEHGKALYSYRSLAKVVGVDKSKVELYVKLHTKTTADAKQLILDDPTFPPRMVVEIGGIEDLTDRTYLINLVKSSDDQGRRMPTNELIRLVSEYKRAQQQPAQTRQNESIQDSSSTKDAIASQEIQSGVIAPSSVKQIVSNGQTHLRDEEMSAEAAQSSPLSNAAAIVGAATQEEIHAVTTVIPEHDRTIHPSSAMSKASLQARLARLDDQVDKAFKDIRKIPIDAKGQELLAQFALELKKKIDENLLDGNRKEDLSV